jgi:hypothetical protein
MRKNVFDPYKFDYKQYILETYNLTESPARITDVDYTKNDARLNATAATKVIGRSKLIGEYTYGSFTFDLYYEYEDDTAFYDLLDKRHPFIYLHHEIEDIKLDGLIGGMSVDIWKWKTMDGLAHHWMFDYVLPKYEFIMSDVVHTSKGERFWKYLIKEALSKKLKCAVANRKNNDIVPFDNIDKFESYYTDDIKDYQFIILK